jgi:hypothetical protein
MLVENTSMTTAIRIKTDELREIRDRFDEQTVELNKVKFVPAYIGAAYETYVSDVILHYFGDMGIMLDLHTESNSGDRWFKLHGSNIIILLEMKGQKVSSTTGKPAGLNEKEYTKFMVDLRAQMQRRDSNFDVWSGLIVSRRVRSVYNQGVDVQADHVCLWGEVTSQSIVKAMMQAIVMATERYTVHQRTVSMQRGQEKLTEMMSMIASQAGDHYQSIKTIKKCVDVAQKMFTTHQCMNEEKMADLYTTYPTNVNLTKVGRLLSIVPQGKFAHAKTKRLKLGGKKRVRSTVTILE